MSEKRIERKNAVITITILDEGENLQDFITHTDIMWPGRPEGMGIEEWVNIKIKKFIKKLYKDAVKLNAANDAEKAANAKPELKVE